MDDLGLLEFVGQNPRSTFLDLSDAVVTDAGLERLQGLISLKVLNLRRTKVTDAGLKHLEGRSSLKKLYLDSSKVTDAGLEHLKGLTSLEELHLCFTKVTDFELRRHLEVHTNRKALKAFVAGLMITGGIGVFKVTHLEYSRFI